MQVPRFDPRDFAAPAPTPPSDSPTLGTMRAVARSGELARMAGLLRLELAAQATGNPSGGSAAT